MFLKKKVFSWINTKLPKILHNEILQNKLKRFKHSHSLILYLRYHVLTLKSRFISQTSYRTRMMKKTHLNDFISCPYIVYHFGIEIRKSRGYNAIANFRIISLRFSLYHLFFSSWYSLRSSFTTRFLSLCWKEMCTLRRPLISVFSTNKLQVSLSFSVILQKPFNRMLSKGEWKHKKYFLNHTLYYIVIKHLSSYECTDNFFFTFLYNISYRLVLNVIPWYQNTIQIDQHSNSFPFVAWQFTERRRISFHCTSLL